MVNTCGVSAIQLILKAAFSTCDPPFVVAVIDDLREFVANMAANRE